MPLIFYSDFSKIHWKNKKKANVDLCKKLSRGFYILKNLPNIMYGMNKSVNLGSSRPGEVHFIKIKKYFISATMAAMPGVPAQSLRYSFTFVGILLRNGCVWEQVEGGGDKMHLPRSTCTKTNTLVHSIHNNGQVLLFQKAFITWLF